MTAIMSSPVQSSPVQSIIIPTYNRKDMLIEAINSVLNQTQKSLEIIVVDDCSTDGTEEYIRGMNDERVRYFRNEKNSGQEYSRMIGFRQARGKYITFLDDDDYYTDNEFFAKAIKIFGEHENDNIPLAMVCANAKFLNTATGESYDSNIGRPGRVKGIDYILKPEYGKPPSVFPAVFSAEALRCAGLADMIIFDSATYLQAAFEGDAWFIPDIIGVYRVSLSNFTHKKASNPESEERHYRVMQENVLRWKNASERLCVIMSRKKADSWYIRNIVSLADYYAIARPGIKDRLHTLIIILKVSGFMPRLWLNIIVHFIWSKLRKITPLRKLYRFIKYRLRGKPYPED